MDMKRLLLTMMMMTAAMGEFSPCSISPMPPGVTMTCETMEVPLDYEDPAGEMIKVFTRRVAPAAQTLEGAIVFIEGGPGLSEQGADVYGAAMLALGHSIAVYLPDRRGNGMSTYIDCPTLIPFEECVQFINTTYGWDYVQHFTVSNQARDLHAVISSTPELAENPLVYSRSYGTYLMQRYMVLFPDSLTRVVLDGVAPADLLKTPVIDLNQNFVGLELGARCGADPECASLFPRNDPVGAFYSVERALAYGDIAPACSSDLGLTAENLPEVLDRLVNTWEQRVAIPAVIYRIARCSPADVAALSHLMGSGYLDTGLGGSPGNDSMLMTVNIIFSELWMGGNVPSDIDCDAIDAFTFASLVAGGVAKLYCPGYEQWHTYAADKYVGQYPAVKPGQVLLLNGDLDPATPIFWMEHAAAQLTAAGSLGPGDLYKVVIPNACHTTSSCSPIVGSYSTSNPLWFFEGSCGTQIFTSFLLSGGPPNTTCIDDIYPVDWLGVQEMTQDASQSLFGTPDLYG